MSFLCLLTKSVNTLPVSWNLEVFPPNTKNFAKDHFKKTFRFLTHKLFLALIFDDPKFCLLKNLSNSGFLEFFQSFQNIQEIKKLLSHVTLWIIFRNIAT